MLSNLIVIFLSKLQPYFLRMRKPSARLGKNVKIDFATQINIGNNSLYLGDNVKLRSEIKGYHAAMAFPTTILLDGERSECLIGNNSRINGVYIHAKKSISIGENCVIAAGVNILDSNGHILISRDRTIGRDKPYKIVLKNNVWVGLNSIILKGTIIGNNSVVAANSVVKGHFPDNVLIQGNPAVIVREIDIKDC